MLISLFREIVYIASLPLGGPGWALGTLPFNHRPHHKPEMLAYSGKCSVVVRHNLEPFDKGCLMTLSCHSSFEERAKSLVGIHKLKTLFLSLFHYSDTPIHIGGIFVFEIIGHLSCYVCSCIESLMANQHPFLETLPREHLWR